MKVLLIVLLVLALLVAVVIAAEDSGTKGGCQIIEVTEEGTLYYCGPQCEDLCFDDGIGTTKIRIDVR